MAEGSKAGNGRKAGRKPFVRPKLTYHGTLEQITMVTLCAAVEGSGSMGFRDFMAQTQGD
jgi:hypothetical protein